MEKKHIIRTLENTPVDIGDTLYQVIDCETPYIREITVTGFRCEPDGVAMMCRAENSGRDVRLDVERWGADVFESKADAERGLAGLKARRDAAPDGFDAVLMERPFDGAIDHRDVVRMLALLDFFHPHGDRPWPGREDGRARPGVHRPAEVPAHDALRPATEGTGRTSNRPQYRKSRHSRRRPTLRGRSPFFFSVNLDEIPRDE